MHLTIIKTIVVVSVTFNNNNYINIINVSCRYVLLDVFRTTNLIVYDDSSYWFIPSSGHIVIVVSVDFYVLNTSATLNCRREHEYINNYEFL